MRRTILSAAGGAVLALTAGTAAFADARPSSTAPPTATSAVDREDAAALRDEERAIALSNAAARALARTRPSCVARPRIVTTYTHAAPSKELLDLLILLRRPPIPLDREVLNTRWLDGLSARGIYVDWTRMGRAADGHEVYLVPAQESWRPKPMSAACLRLQHNLLVRLIRKEPARVRKIALRIDAEIRRNEKKLKHLPTREVLYSFDRATGGGSGADIDQFRRQGLFISMQPTMDDHSTVTGWVPDGVATVEVSYPRQVSKGPHRPAIVYGNEIRLTIPAQDNLVSYQVDRPAEDAWPPLLIWHAADGTVLRTIRKR